MVSQDEASFAVVGLTRITVGQSPVTDWFLVSWSSLLLAIGLNAIPIVTLPADDSTVVGHGIALQRVRA